MSCQILCSRKLLSPPPTKKNLDTVFQMCWVTPIFLAVCNVQKCRAECKSWVWLCLRQTFTVPKWNHYPTRRLTCFFFESYSSVKVVSDVEAGSLIDQGGKSGGNQDWLNILKQGFQDVEQVISTFELCIEFLQ